MKRVFVPVIFMLIVILLGCKKEDAKKDNDKIRGCRNSFSFNYNPLATEDDESCEDMHGCLGYVTGQGNSGSAGLTLSNAYWDQKMSEEVTIQRNFFGEILAAVFILYEPSPEYKNAYATPDGKILFGYFMFYYTIQSYGELPVAGILAHEWGHRVQFTVGWNDYYKPNHRELEADAFSGFYMALAKQYAWSSIRSYYENVYASGDYNFNSPMHHGTPDQRVKAAYFGVTTAVNAMQTGTQYTYDQLHALFFGYIKTNIAGRGISGLDKEVRYPKMRRKDIEKLFPKT